MSRDNVALGGAVPPNWSFNTSRRTDNSASTSEAPPATRNAVNVLQNDDVGDLIAANGWPVRDQYDRGTCTAFAVVAAEELYRRLKPAATWDLLSEEHLYAAIRSFHPRDDAGVAVSDDQVAKNNRDGATYLAQAREALIKRGLCASAVMAYERDRHVAYYVKDVPALAAADAEDRTVAREGLVHNIIDIENGDLPPRPTTWIHRLQNPLADVFWLQLSQNVPVVASFAIMDLHDWFDDTAWDWGEIRYDADHGDRPVGGHTVCLTGYVPPVAGDTTSGGWFQFRNSLGREFAHEFANDPHAPIVIAKGYGHISAADVNTYCWEYLHRASPPGI